MTPSKTAQMPIAPPIRRILRISRLRLIAVFLELK
jgi:hypothetical protein